MPFTPLHVTTAGNGTDQRLQPVLHANGLPVWEAGDTNVQTWPAIGLGTCHGSIGNQQIHSDIAAVVYLTDARTVVVSANYAKGAKYRSGALISTAIRNNIAQRHAERDAAGTFLSGQMRHPWVSRVVWAPREGRKQLNTIRVCGTHTTEFGDHETVMLIVQFDRDTDPSSVAHTISSAVIADRRNWDTTTDDERGSLDHARFTEPHTLPADELPSIRLVGGYIVSAGSARHGVNSSRSYPAPSS